VALGLIVGIGLSVVSALSGRHIGGLILRMMDVILAFPAIILALVLALMLGHGRSAVVVVIAIVLVPQVVRIVRPRLVSELQKEYVLAERATGASTSRILGYHVARNILSPVSVFAVLALADAMLFEAALSFLGLGIQPPDPSWGNMLADGQKVLTAGAWWLSVFPGVVLFLTVLSLSTLVDRHLARVAGEMHRTVV
jgi:peptide/nickel transport system permease protein